MPTSARKWKVWWTEPFPEIWKEYVHKLERSGCKVVVGRPTTEADRPFSEAEILERGKDADALLVIAREKITSRILENLKKLKVIVKAGIGVDNIDVQAATRNGVLVANTPVAEDYLGVAEGTVARLLALAKRLAVCDESVKEGPWLDDYDRLKGLYVRGRTVGIVGLGRIGSQVAKLLQPWGVKVIACDPYVQKEKAGSLSARLVGFDTLLRESDFLTVHAVLTPETKHMINLEAFRKMKRTAYLINTARGAIVDENALCRALRDGMIAGAALDVFEREPAGGAILSQGFADRLLLSPHVSGLSIEMERGLTSLQVDSCLRALNGEPPHSTLNPEAVGKWKGKFSAG